MKTNRNLALTCIIFTVIALCGDLLLLLVVNSLRAGVHVQSITMLAVGGLLGCISIPLAYASGFAVMARVIRPTAKTMAAIMLFCGIAAAIIGPIIHAMTWMSIRSAIITGAVSSSSPMEAMVEQGGLLLNLWIIGVVLLLAISILIVWSGIRRPRAIPLWLAFLNPIVLNLLIGTLGSFSDIGRSYLVPLAPNLAHIGFFIALYWCLHSGKLQQPAYS